MPHLVVLYTRNLDALLDFDGLCRELADTMLLVRDESGAQVFPTGGTRVLAFPAAHSAVADGGAAGRAAGRSGDYGFVYLNLRMGLGRSTEVKKAAGDSLMDVVRRRFAPVLEANHVGVTLQIDESPSQVYDAKLSNLHPLFK